MVCESLPLLPHRVLPKNGLRSRTAFIYRRTVNKSGLPLTFVRTPSLDYSLRVPLSGDPGHNNPVWSLTVGGEGLLKTRCAGALLKLSCM
jgi:hypothetical protein